MTKVIVSKQIKVSAHIVWEKLSSFRGIEKFSPIERSETNGNGVGATRTCYLPDGAAIYEVLNMVDNHNMELQYEITEGPFPISSYTSIIKVEAIGMENCKISWSCNFESSEENKDEMINLFEGFYNVIIDSLESLIVNQN